MNPFLIALCVIFWVVFFIVFIFNVIHKLDGDLGTLILFVFAIFVTILCAVSWHDIHYNHNGPPPAIE